MVGDAIVEDRDGGEFLEHMHYVPSRDDRRFLVNTQTGPPSPNPITLVLNWSAALKK